MRIVSAGIKLSLVIIYFQVFNHCFVLCLSDDGLAAMAETEGVNMQSDVIPSPPSFAQVSRKSNVYSLDAKIWCKARGILSEQDDEVKDKSLDW